MKDDPQSSMQSTDIQSLYGAYIQQQQKQIETLQAAVAYLEITVDGLDQVIAKQDKQLQDMQRQLQLMYKQFNKQSESGIAPFDADSEVPPHY